MDLGSGGTENSCIARIPSRFFRESKAKGINVEEFLKRQQHEILAQEAYGNINHQLGHRQFLTTPVTPSKHRHSLPTGGEIMIRRNKDGYERSTSCIPEDSVCIQRTTFIYEERATVRNRLTKDEDICMKNSSESSVASAEPHSLSISDQILNVSMPLLMLLIYCYWKS